MRIDYIFGFVTNKNLNTLVEPILGTTRSGNAKLCSGILVNRFVYILSSYRVLIKNTKYMFFVYTFVKCTYKTSAHILHISVFVLWWDMYTICENVCVCMLDSVLD